MAEPKDLNTRVLVWARGQIGKKVLPHGECWDLPHQALRNSGGESSYDGLGPKGSKADYVWGDMVYQNQDALPGDIIQFKDYVISGKMLLKVIPKNGSDPYEVVRDYEKKRGHHCAIIDSIVSPQEWRVLEQNVKPLGKVVQLNVLQIVGGEFRSNSQWEEKFEDDRKRQVLATVKMSSFSAQISGTFTVYRPKQKTK